MVQKKIPKQNSMVIASFQNNVLLCGASQQEESQDQNLLITSGSWRVEFITGDTTATQLWGNTPEFLSYTICFFKIYCCFQIPQQYNVATCREFQCLWWPS